MSSFQINATDPPNDASYPRAPVDGGSYYRLVLPKSAGLDGLGRPVGASGKPYVEVYFDTLPIAGWNWYCAFTGAALSVALTSLRVLNPWTGAYVTYTSGRMHRPEYERLVWAEGAVEGVYILFSGLG